MNIPRGLRTSQVLFPRPSSDGSTSKRNHPLSTRRDADFSRNFVFFVDENPLPFVQRFHWIGTIVGLLLASTAVVAAIFSRFPYWYTPFTIGSFLFFDRLSERFAGRSLLRFLAHGHWRVGVLMYFARRELRSSSMSFMGEFSRGRGSIRPGVGLPISRSRYSFITRSAFSRSMRPSRLFAVCLASRGKRLPGSNHLEDSPALTVESPGELRRSASGMHASHSLRSRCAWLCRSSNYWLNANQRAKVSCFLL